MTLSNNLKCWEIMMCDNLDCPARGAPDTPCWEIARRMEDYRNISNTCQDCVVYILKKEPSDLSNKQLKKIIADRGLAGKPAKNYRACILKKLTED